MIVLFERTFNWNMESEYVRVKKWNKAVEWPEWKFEIRVLLNAAKVMDVVSGTEEKPERTKYENVREHKTALMKW